MTVTTKITQLSKSLNNEIPLHNNTIEKRGKNCSICTVNRAADALPGVIHRKISSKASGLICPGVTAAADTKASNSPSCISFTFLFVTYEQINLVQMIGTGINKCVIEHTTYLMNIGRFYTRGRIILLDELSFVVRRSRRTTEDSSSRRIMRLAPE